MINMNDKDCKMQRSLQNATLIKAANEIISQAEQDYVEITYNHECTVAFAQRHNDVAYAKCQHVVQIMNKLINKLINKLECDK
jgi:hypothetical protein